MHNSTLVEIRSHTKYVEYTFDSDKIYQVSFTKKFHKSNPTRFLLVFDLIISDEEKSVKRIALSQHENYVSIAVRTAKQGGYHRFAIPYELNNLLISLAEDITGIDIDEYTFGEFSYR
jgi:hypothetical protein